MRKVLLKHLALMILGIIIIVVIIWIIYMDTIHCSGMYGQPNCTAQVIS